MQSPEEFDAANLPSMPQPNPVDCETGYEVGAQIARGGMGAILDAQQRAMGRRVAMKVMLEGSDPSDVERFVDEARITGQLEHPNIVPVHELAVDDQGQLFYTMKFVRGITLKKVIELLAKGVEGTVKKYPLPALLTIFQKACDAIAFAHSRGVIHRDLKPENIMLGDFGEVLVMDWGLAKVLGTSAQSGARTFVTSTRTQRGDTSRTMSGTVMGTPAYMAPEQARGEVDSLDPRTDIYALGAILFEVLQLRPLFKGEDAWMIVERAKRGAIEWEPLRKGVPDSLLAVCRKALSHDPTQRYSTVEALQAEIAAYQNGFATQAEQAGTWKQFLLFFRRHTALSGAAAVLLLTGAVFTISLVRERNAARRAQTNAELALSELRRTAPTFFDQARLLVEREKFDEALEKIEIALSLDPASAPYLQQRAHILQSMERFGDAADAYRTALRRDPRLPYLEDNIRLSESLAKSRANGELPLPERTRWRDALTAQGRSAEAIFAGKGLSFDPKKMLPHWQAKIDAWLGKDAPRLTIGSDRNYSLALGDFSVSDLSPLRGMPLGGFYCNANPKLTDISPLAGLPITNLQINNCPAVRDFSPLSTLKGMRLLQLSGASLTDLSPLKGFEQLEELYLISTPVTDLSPLRGCRNLARLWMGGTKVRSLEPLRGLPLTNLSMERTPVESLEPIGSAPLTHLIISKCPRLDLAHLKSRQLRFLTADDTILDHPEVLAEMKQLEGISLPKNPIDPNLLRNLPKLRKINPINGPMRSGNFETALDAADFWKQVDRKER